MQYKNNRIKTTLSKKPKRAKEKTTININRNECRGAISIIITWINEMWLNLIHFAFYFSISKHLFDISFFSSEATNWMNSVFSKRVFAITANLLLSIWMKNTKTNILSTNHYHIILVNVVNWAFFIMLNATDIIIRFNYFIYGMNFQLFYFKLVNKSWFLINVTFITD